MAEEITPEQAQEIVSMLTQGGAMESINTSLALGILPLVESIGDFELLQKLVEHAGVVAKDDIETVLGPFGGRFWCSRGPLGRCFGTRRTDFDIQN